MERSFPVVPVAISLVATIAVATVAAIGTGLTATPETAQDVHAGLRRWFNREHSSELSSELRILYGGSVTVENAADLMRQPDIDGALVGGASLDAKSFLGIARFKS